MRIFIACNIPESLKERLEDFQESLKSDEDKIKWVEKENLHLTMKFIGETDEKDIEEIKRCLSTVKFKPFLTSVSDFGVFPLRGHIRVVWMGLSPANQINDLHEKIESSLDFIGLEKDSLFQPHITLGRVKFIGDKEEFIRKVSEIKTKFESEPFKIDRFILKKSVLTPQGPVYTDLAEFGSE
ncbi:MAG: RNA 2',3'-cyclic phosphodiesterase [Candidatus Aenigmarchaeota archaeon]|nr:RNA 2',3'-cyclic phosphodiesterase [Candidatus Aenigmarchaeota archaeon]